MTYIRHSKFEDGIVFSVTMLNMRSAWPAAVQMLLVHNTFSNSSVSIEIIYKSLSSAKFRDVMNFYGTIRYGTVNRTVMAAFTSENLDASLKIDAAKN